MSTTQDRVRAKYSRDPAREDMDEEQYACWLEFAEYMLQWPSVAGVSNHGLMICRKED